MNFTTQYRCSSCNLVGEVGSDDLYDGNGIRVGTEYYICSACGACHSECWIDGKTIIIVTPPSYYQKEAPASREVVLDVPRMNITAQECLYCRNEGTVVSGFTENPALCPNCHQQTLKKY